MIDDPWASVAGLSLGPTGPAVDRAPDGPRYRRETLLGEGGMGRVWLAWDHKLACQVALKEALPGSEDALMREARIAAGLDHPGVIAVLDTGLTDEGRPFYAMRLVRGRSLADVLRTTPAGPGRMALLTHFRDAAHTLGFAHTQGVIHRDVKPANLLVGSFGETLVVDWGLAGPPGQRADGAVVGTPAWLSPEAATGGATDARTDVFGLGAALYHLLAGHPPHPQDDLAAALHAAALGHVRPLDEVAPDTPPELRAIVGKALAADPDDRYPDGNALAADLERYLTGDRVDAHAYSARELLGRVVRAYRAPLAVSGIGALAVATLSIVGVGRLAAERDRAVRAEQVASASLGRAHAEAAQQAAMAGALGDAALHAVASREEAEDPEARGALVAGLSQLGLRRVDARDAHCPGAVLLPDGMLCSDGAAVWRLDGGDTRWRVDVAALDVAVAGDVVAITDTRGVVPHDLHTGTPGARFWRQGKLPLVGGAGGRFASRKWEGASWWGGLDPADRLALTGCDGHGPAREAILHPTEPLHASWCADGVVALTDATGAVRHLPTGLSVSEHSDAAAMAFAGPYLTIAHYRGALVRLDLRDGAVEVRLRRGRRGVLQIAPGDGRLALRDETGVVEVWATEGLVPLAVLPGAGASAVGWAGSTLRVLRDGREERWTIGRGPAFQHPEPYGMHTFALTDGVAITAHSDGLAVARRLDGAASPVRVTVGEATVMGVAADGLGFRAHAVQPKGVWGFDAAGRPTGERFGSESYRAILDLQDGTMLGMPFEGRVFRLRPGGVQAVTPCEDKEWIGVSPGGGDRPHLLLGQDEQVVAVDGDGCVEPVQGLRAREAVAGPAGAWFVVADRAAVRRVARDGTEGWRLPVADAVLDLALSPSADLVASAGVDQAVRLVDADTGRLRAVLRGHTMRVSTVRFTADGRHLVSGSWDGSLRVWALDALDTTAEAARAALVDAGWPVEGQGQPSTTDTSSN